MLGLPYFDPHPDLFFQHVLCVRHGLRSKNNRRGSTPKPWRCEFTSRKVETQAVHFGSLGGVAGTLYVSRCGMLCKELLFVLTVLGVGRGHQRLGSQPGTEMGSSEGKPSESQTASLSSG